MALYPFVKRLYYRVDVSEQVKDFEDVSSQMNDKEMKKRMEFARATTIH